MTKENGTPKMDPEMVKRFIEAQRRDRDFEAAQEVKAVSEAGRLESPYLITLKLTALISERLNRKASQYARGLGDPEPFQRFKVIGDMAGLEPPHALWALASKHGSILRDWALGLRSPGGGEEVIEVGLDYVVYVLLLMTMLLEDLEHGRQVESSS